MRSCPKCNNFAPEGAVSCPHCGTLLDASMIPRATGSARPRIPTITEGSEPPRPTIPPKIEYRPSPPPSLAPSLGVSVASPAQSPSSGRRGQTVYLPSNLQASIASTPAPSIASRRVVAVVVTYSWKPDGQVFPIREGRNLIGRGEECEIRIPEDAMLSTVNTHITYRQSFTMGDMVSMSGTDLNGEPVQEQFRPITNLARIRAGSTHLLFVVVDPAILGIEA